MPLCCLPCVCREFAVCSRVSPADSRGRRKHGRAAEGGARVLAAATTVHTSTRSHWYAAVVHAHRKHRSVHLPPTTAPHRSKGYRRGLLQCGSKISGPTACLLRRHSTYGRLREPLSAPSSHPSCVKLLPARGCRGAMPIGQRLLRWPAESMRGPSRWTKPANELHWPRPCSRSSSLGAQSQPRRGNGNRSLPLTAVA